MYHDLYQQKGKANICSDFIPQHILKKNKLLTQEITELLPVNSPEYIWKSAYHTAYSTDCHIQKDQFSRIPSGELAGSLFDRDQHQAM
jgi:hypothetical protein